MPLPPVITRKTHQETQFVPSLVQCPLQLQHGWRLLHPVALLSVDAHAMTGVSWSVAEDDDTLTEEEKAVLRFQQQRMQDAASDRSASPLRNP